MAQKTLPGQKRAITLAVHSRAKSVELVLRKEIEKFINPLILSALRIPKNQFRLLFVEDTRTITFTEKIIIRKGKRYAILCPSAGATSSFLDAETDIGIEIASHNPTEEPSLSKYLEQVGGLFIETENWLELLMPNMRSTGIMSSGRSRFWKTRFLVEKKPNTKQSFLISEIYLEYKMLHTTKKKKKQF